MIRKEDEIETKKYDLNPYKIESLEEELIHLRNIKWTMFAELREAVRELHHAAQHPYREDECLLAHCGRLKRINCGVQR